MTDRVALGQQRPTRMRRIGDRHMIVLPMQTAKVMSVDDLEQALRVARQQEQQTQAQLDRHRGYIADLQQQLDWFRALPIERDPDDPEVPQPEPPPRALRTARAVTASGSVVHGLARQPIGEPEPPPKLTDE